MFKAYKDIMKDETASTKWIIYGFSIVAWFWIIVATLTGVAFALALALGSVKLLIWVVGLF